MKAFVFAGLFLLSTASFAANIEVINCVSPESGAPTYSVEVSDAEPGQTFVVKSFPSSSQRDPIRLELQARSQVWGYGGTYILSKNLGRSGYALVYFDSNSGKSVIDINLFMNNDANTGGPLTNYACTVR